MTISTKPNWKLAAGIPVFIFLCCYLVTLSAKFKLNNGLLSNAILFDLLITAPLAYLMVIRKSSVSKLTVSRIFITGLLIAGLILNAHSNTLLLFIKTWVAPSIEAMIILLIGRKFYVANKKARLSGNGHVDFLAYCRRVMFQVTGNEKAGNIISSEIAVFYYAFIAKRHKNIDYTSTFTGYKENGIILILATFLSLFLIETTGVHFLLSLWNKPIAWILTGLSFYTCIQLYGHIKAIKARPITISPGSLEIRNGLAGDAYIQTDNIEKIELNNKLPLDRKSIKIALIQGLENHNVVVYLKKPVQVNRIFGIKKTADTVLFFVDRPKDFIHAIYLVLKNHDIITTNSTIITPIK